MKRTTLTHIAFLLLFNISVCHSAEFTESMLRNMLKKSEAEHNRRDGTLKGSEMDRIIKDRKIAEKSTDDVIKDEKVEEKTNEVLDPPGSVVAVKPNDEHNEDTKIKPESSDNSKNEKNSAHKATSASKVKSVKTKKSTKINNTKSTKYIPPSWRNSKAPTTVAVTEGVDTPSIKNRPYFGIRIGTQFRAKLESKTSNVQPGEVELTVDGDVYGDFRVMESGTKLFCQRSIIPGTTRLSLKAIHGVAPDGKVFRLDGYIFDMTNTNGLHGTVANDGKTFDRSMSAAGFAGLKSVAETAVNSTVAGEMVGAAADIAIDENETETKLKNNAPKLVIYTEPQDVFVRANKTF